MSTSIDPSPAPPVPPTFVHPEPRSGRSTGRRVAIWLGAAVALFGAVVAIAGGALFALFGSDGVLRTDRHALSTPTSALVSKTASIDSANGIDDLGNTRIRIDARAAGGRPVFVGVARATDVERYLAGAATDEVTDFNAGAFRSSFTIDRERHPGHVIPAAPGAQSFWVARSSGRDRAVVNWKVRDGDYRAVVMNADGSRGVATRSTLGIEVPWIPGVAIGILVAGLLLTAGGVVAIVVGAQRPSA